jgi:hypothetical protein
MYKVHYKITLNSGALIEFDSSMNKSSVAQVLALDSDLLSNVCRFFLGTNISHKTYDGRLVIIKESQIASIELTDCSE